MRTCCDDVDVFLCTGQSIDAAIGIADDVECDVSSVRKESPVFECSIKIIGITASLDQFGTFFIVMCEGGEVRVQSFREGETGCASCCIDTQISEHTFSAYIAEIPHQELAEDLRIIRIAQVFIAAD